MWAAIDLPINIDMITSRNPVGVIESAFTGRQAYSPDRGYTTYAYYAIII